MYGFINTCLKSLVIERFGEEIWDKLRNAAGVQDTFLTFEVYGDDITMQLVTEACKLLDVQPDDVLRQFGEYFFRFCKSSGYDHMLRALGGNLFEFMENLDALHSYLSLSYKEMSAPSFRVEKNTSDNTMFLHYYSNRRGLCHIVPGIIGAAAKDFFNSEITMEIVGKGEDEEQTGKKEHIVFSVTQTPIISNKMCSSNLLVPCDISGVRHVTPIGGDKLHFQGWESIQGPVCQENSVENQNGKLLKGFAPVYPDFLCIDVKTFCHVFPFHIVFDKDLRVKQAGVNIQRIVPGLQTMHIRLDQYFTILHPEVTFTICSIRKFINSHFVLQTRQDAMPKLWSDRPMLELRGQMMWMEGLQCMLYQASPLLRSLHELEEQHMHISDIAPHDATRDLILLNQQRLAEIELSNQLERKKEELRHLSHHLEDEKKKTENLLYAMLPKHVANQLKEGRRVDAGEFKECTILFSDVVTFTNICAKCEPIQIVCMLNSMYLRFDRLTTVHNVYKVETIGDAYMVVGGVPIPIASHAEQVANFGLEIIIAAQEVTNPVTGDPIQIRVGMHSGPVLAGVVGEKMPRYCLFGDTVNTASRMESHGVPNKIHLSLNVYEALKDKGFRLVERGEIDVKGKGKMCTYFLEANLTATDKEIMGRSPMEVDFGCESAQSDRGGKTSAALFQPEIKGKPRNSESYGSLHSGNFSDHKRYQLPTNSKKQAAIQSGQKRVRTRLCVVL